MGQEVVGVESMQVSKPEGLFGQLGFSAVDGAMHSRAEGRADQDQSSFMTWSQ
jgi:hypothetical protein